MEPESSLPYSQAPVNCRGQPKRGGPTAWELGEALTAPPREKQNVMRYTSTICVQNSIFYTVTEYVSIVTSGLQVVGLTLVARI